MKTETTNNNTLFEALLQATTQWDLPLTWEDLYEEAGELAITDYASALESDIEFCDISYWDSEHKCFGDCDYETLARDLFKTLPPLVNFKIIDLKKSLSFLARNYNYAFLGLNNEQVADELFDPQHFDLEDVIEDLEDRDYIKITFFTSLSRSDMVDFVAETQGN